MDYVINPNTLKALRNRKQWTQAALAEESGVNRKTIMRIEGDTPYRVRTNTAKQLADALGVGIEILIKELPNSEKNGESQIFIDLERSIQEHDHASSMKIIEYLTCKLAYALDACHIELDKGWIAELHNVTRPVPALTPEWQPYFEETEPYDAAYEVFLKELYRELEKEKCKDGMVLPVSTEYLLGDCIPENRQEAFLDLPIKVNGRIDAYRVRAYLRKKSRVPAGNLQLILVPNIDKEMWTVIPCVEG